MNLNSNLIMIFASRVEPQFTFYAIQIKNSFGKIPELCKRFYGSWPLPFSLKPIEEFINAIPFDTGKKLKFQMEHILMPWSPEGKEWLLWDHISSQNPISENHLKGLW